MSFEIISTTRFEKEIKKISLVYPRVGATQPIQGPHLGHGIYKVRIPITGKSTGKSYGARTLHVVFSADKKIYLLSVYDKSEKKDLSSNEVKELVQIVKTIKSL